MTTDQSTTPINLPPVRKTNPVTTALIVAVAVCLFPLLAIPALVCLADNPRREG